MADTIRERIIQNIITGLAVVRTANGYNTDCGRNVQRAISNLDSSEIDAFVVWPGPEESVRKYGISNISMSLRVEGLAIFGEENHSVVSEKILGDIIRVMTGVIDDEDAKTRMTGGLAEDIQYVTGGTEAYPENEDTAVGAAAEFAVKYQTVAGDPYNQ